MSTLLNSYFVKTHRLEISITIIAIVLFLIYFLGAPHVFTRFPIYRAFMQSMPFFGIIAISATFVVTLGELDLSFPSIVGMPILVTRRPLISPANMPSAEANTKAMKKLPSVAVKIKPKVSDVIPTMDGNDKSISPSVTTNVAEIAMIPKKGIDCIKAL